MSGTTAVICTGLAAFAGSHMYLSHPGNREYFIKQLGSKEKFLGAYSGIACLTLLPAAAAYIKGRNTGPVFWNINTSPVVRFIGDSFKLFGVVALPQAMLNPSPLGKAGEVASGKGQPTDPKGFQRITRHGLFFGFGSFGLGAALTSSHLNNVLFWGFFPLFWYAGSLHQDYRKRLDKEIPEEYFQKTSILPFQAIIEGRNTLQLEELSWKAALGSIAVASMYRYRNVILKR